MPKEVKPQKDSVVNPTKLQFQIISNRENFDAPETLRINQSRPHYLSSCVPWDLWSISSDTHQVM